MKTYEIEHNLLNPNNKYSSQEYLQPLFVLKELSLVEKFKEEAKGLLPEHYKIVDNGESFAKIIAPMENIRWIANIVLYVAVGATILILSLLITLFLRDRKHEIGIYLSLGEKKIKVIGQILAEVLLIAIISITLSLVSGNLIAKGVSKQMLNNQIVAEQEKANQNNNGMIMYSSESSLDYLGYGINISDEELLESYSVKLGFDIILMFYLIGLRNYCGFNIVPNSIYS